MDIVAMGRIGFDLFANDFGKSIKDVKTFSKYLGGSPANFAIGVARLGAKVGFISKVGDDAPGEFLRDFMKEEGIDVQLVSIARKFRTSLALVEVSPPDRFPVTFYRKDCADLQISIDDVDLEYISRAEIFLTSGTSLSDYPSRETILYVLDKISKTDVCVVLDADYRSQVWDDIRVARLYYRLALRFVDIFIANREEIEFLCDTDDIEEAVKQLMAQGPRIIVVKLGSLGSKAFTEKGSIFAPPYKVKVISSNGAGDAFAAGFCYGFLKKWDIERCLELGNAVGAIVASKLGCSEAMPTLSEAREFIEASQKNLPVAGIDRSQGI